MLQLAVLNTSKLNGTLHTNGKASSAALCTVQGHAASMIWRLAGTRLKYFANYYLIVQLPWA